MQIIADFHIHSRFARACSKQLNLPNIEAWARVKGIELMGTGDFTHPVWLSEIASQIKEVQAGIFKLKDKFRAPLPYNVKNPTDVRFLITSEISTIWSQGGKVRRSHTIIVAPSMDFALKFTDNLKPIAKLASDGRPIIGISARELAQRAWSIDERALVIPAHAWTPWFSVFGSKSGFDSLEECFGSDLYKRIPAIETGLSSDPAMNYRVSALDDVTLISCSDAHSLDNLGREATLLEVEDFENFNFNLLSKIIREGAPSKADTRDTKNYLAGTIEFFPEEGKYHNDGHSKCKVSLTPQESKKIGEICPACNRKLTVGVLSRVDDLADREYGFIPSGAPKANYIVPIRDILTALLKKGKKTKTVDNFYRNLVENIGTEFALLMHAPIDDIAKVGGIEFAGIVSDMRQGKVKMQAGYDGEYGKLILPIKSSSTFLAPELTA